MAGLELQGRTLGTCHKVLHRARQFILKQGGFNLEARPTCQWMGDNRGFSGGQKIRGDKGCENRIRGIILRRKPGQGSEPRAVGSEPEEAGAKDG